MSGTLDVMDGAPGLFAAAPPERQRPPGVPADATWSERNGEWQLRPADELGRLHGLFRSWREDGSARELCTYEHDLPAGVAWKFHPDGSLFSLGCFTSGKERGVHRRYANENPAGEQLQSCCVPRGAWQLRLDYSVPNAVERGWFDRDGRRLLDNGDPYPDRPPGVPRDAWFDEQQRAWEAGVIFEEKGYTGTRMRWSPDGVLRLIEDLIRGTRHGRVRSFDDRGVLEWEGHYIDGRLSGAFRAPLMPARQFLDPAIGGRAGTFESDQAIGVWQYFDAGGALLAERDLGLPLDRQTLAASPALEPEARPTMWWRSLAQTLFAQRRVGEALLAAARASAAAADVTDIAAALAGWTQPLRPDVAIAEAVQVTSTDSENPVALVDALKSGSDASTILWALGKAWPDNDRAALDLVSAAVLLSPSSADRIATRALLHGSLGDLAAARVDVARVAAISPEQGEFLEMYLRIYFPRFSFWPTAESLVLDPQEAPAPLEVVRTVPEVSDVIRRYATRLGALRTALLALLPREIGSSNAAAEAQNQTSGGGEGVHRPSFVIPDLSALLPEGPVPLNRWTFQMSAEEYEGSDQEQAGDQDNEAVLLATDANAASDSEAPSTIEIAVDETRNVAPAPSAILRILRCARADWSGLVWLCWAVGLQAPGLPDAIRPPAAFARAAVMTMERTWRCRDRLRTSGLLALTKGIPGFDWEGTPIDLVPSAFVDVALDEYIEARAVFSWLCDSSNRSPWQDDLRNADG